MFVDSWILNGTYTESAYVIMFVSQKQRFVVVRILPLRKWSLLKINGFDALRIESHDYPTTSSEVFHYFCRLLIGPNPKQVLPQKNSIKILAEPPLKIRLSQNFST